MSQISESKSGPVVSVLLPMFNRPLYLARALDRVLADCDGDYVAVVPAGFPVSDMWLENSLYALLNTANDREAFELEGSAPTCWVVVAHKGPLHLVRGKSPHLPVREGLEAAGVSVRRLRPDEMLRRAEDILQGEELSDKRTRVITNALSENG